ncbi:MAG TPA: MraY family glycosyltransferase, partial [Flavobacteriales bacterium]
SGTSIRLLGDPVWDGVLTVFWTVGMMNSINMLDNMDAITTVTSIFILAAGLISLLLLDQATEVDTVLVIGTMGALCGFLFHNWNPSRMYMGDTGSQFLGVFLAYIGIRCFWNAPSLMGTMEPWRQVVGALVVFALPIIDTTSVTINRIGRGTSPFVGGKDHTTHHLSYAGLSDAQVALVFMGLGLVSCFLSFTMLRFVPEWSAVHTLVFGGYVLLLFAFLFGLTKRTRIDRSLRPDV